MQDTKQENQYKSKKMTHELIVVSFKKTLKHLEEQRIFNEERSECLFNAGQDKRAFKYKKLAEKCLNDYTMTYNQLLAYYNEVKASNDVTDLINYFDLEGTL